ncbi:STM4504/CBY_0614 family protein [Sphingorhabdus sp.]|jgi:hypothetical protein|uniref:STM4504/CBY_0614 family protein n=1 Tax=Sphingorhabdus sp. TaxID=1902408 RepID=UPI0037CB33CD
MPYWFDFVFWGDMLHGLGLMRSGIWFLIFDLYSKRTKRQANSNLSDVYQYDSVPNTLRVQVQQILVDAIGPQFAANFYAAGAQHKHNPDAWEFIHKALCKEFGVHSLRGKQLALANVVGFIGNAGINEFLDTVEMCCTYIIKLKMTSEHNRKNVGITQEPDSAIDEINYRFREACLGYQIEEGKFIRVDSQFMHQEVVKPAIHILNSEEFSGPRSEFLSAHESFRNGDYERAIILASNSFESTLKVVCDKNRWVYQKGARATDLLKLVKSNGLWPDYLDGSFDQLIATLSSGLPKVRNEAAAHGQGAELRSTPSYVAAYALHLAGAKIILISEAQKNLSKV